MVDVLRGGIGPWWQGIKENVQAQNAAARQAEAEAARKKQEILAKEQLYAERIPSIEVFPGSLYEYENLKGGQRFQIIDVPGKVKAVWGNPQKFFRVLTSHGHHYNEMLARAVDVEATAVIRWEGNSDWQRGIPVRPVQPPVQS